MSRAIRAVYEGGHLRLLDPVELAEGERVEVMISPKPAEPLTPAEPLSEEARMRVALGGSVRFPTPRPSDGIDTEAMQRELDVALKGLPPVSEYIICERREGP